MDEGTGRVVKSLAGRALFYSIDRSIVCIGAYRPVYTERGLRHHINQENGKTNKTAPTLCRKIAGENALAPAMNAYWSASSQADFDKVVSRVKTMRARCTATQMPNITYISAIIPASAARLLHTATPNKSSRNTTKEIRKTILIGFATSTPHTDRE